MSGVSVVIPVKNGSHSLTACIKSFAGQTIKPKEIIIVGSKESTEQVRANLSPAEQKILKIATFLGGKNEARNEGFLRATGEYIIYADHDMKTDANLIEACLKKVAKFNVLIIPEKGARGNFWENVRSLEKEIIMYDINTVTPRFFRKSLFRRGELPFDGRFGLLDEWGFSYQLKDKKAKIGLAESHIIVKEDNLTLGKEIRNKFQRGLWIRRFIATDKNEAWRRIDPLKRGIKFYGSKLRVFKKSPILFSGLLFLKFIDLVSFFTGYLVSFVAGPAKNYALGLEEQSLRVHDRLGGDYLAKMYRQTKWSRHVDEEEKKAVAEIWGLEENKNLHKEIILDVGMGPGRWTRYFLKQGFNKVVGLDISPAMIKYAQKTITDARFQAVREPMNRLLSKSKSFDKVFCFRAFKYSESPREAIGEFSRVLKPGGELLIEFANKSLPNLISKKIAKLVLMFFPGLSLHSRWRYFAKVNFYSQTEIQDLWAPNLFQALSLKPLFILPSIPFPGMIDFLFFPFFKFLDKFLIKVLPSRWFARSWLVLLKKIS